MNALKMSDAKKKKEALDKEADAKPDDKAADKVEKKTEAVAAVSTEVLGEVSYVDSEAGFILIRQSIGKHIAPSTALLSKNPTGTITAKLMASNANKGSFIAADIVSGAPEKGNPIQQDGDVKPKTEIKPATPTLPTNDLAPPTAPPVGPRPKLDTMLPPLTELAPPSDNLEAPELPKLP
jgi:hypothetical protein